MKEEVKQLITDAKNICLIPSPTNEPESLTSALAFFYTLKELGKNVNLITEHFPEKLSFLIPSLDFITTPKNFVISIPQKVSQVSQVYYEKNEADLKIYLTVDKGQIKKEDVLFYFSEVKPDLIITIGIQDFKKELEGALNSFGFILDTPIINIDTSAKLSVSNQENIKFGKINIVENKSISEITLDIIKSLGEPIGDSQQNRGLINNHVANCLFAGLIIHYENFKSNRTTHEIFHICADLIKHGASHQQISYELNKITKPEAQFLYTIFQNLKTLGNYDGSFATLNSNEFYHFGEYEAMIAVEKIKTMGIEDNLLVLWQSHASDPMVKGFFYSKNPDLLYRISEKQQGTYKGDWVFLSIPGSDVDTFKNTIITTI